ncbi:MAG TPA: hypothetical protein VIG24_13925, partial [Acidimicrobiia bacterium]
MADELHTPNHRWYQGRYHIPLAKEDHSKQWIFASGISKIDAWIDLLAGLDYSILGFEPEYVADFANERYRVQGASTPLLADAITHSRSSNATMVDSDGLLKWAPHNLLLRSEEFDDAAWSKSAIGTGAVPVVVANAGHAPDGTATADRLQLDRGSGTGSGDISFVSQFTTAASITATYGIWLKSFDSTTYEVTLRLGTTLFDFAVSVTPDWQFFTLSGTTTVDRVQILLYGNQNPQTADILVWGAHLYRSDLGGMVDNPDRGDSYVPT